MTAPSGRRSRNGYTPVDPGKFVHIDRPSNASLRVAVIVCMVLATLAGAIVCAVAAVPFDPAQQVIYLITATVGAALGATLEARVLKGSGRRRREDFVQCGGDPTGMTDTMFGAMRGWRTAEGNWEIPEQGSGDYV